MGYKINAFTTTFQVLILDSFLKEVEVRIDKGEQSGKYQ